MKLNVNFDRLWQQTQRLTDEKAEFSLDIDLGKARHIDIQLKEGLEVDIEDLGNTGGLFEYKGRQVLLYIPDHGSSVESVLTGQGDGKKFHLCDCKTLKQMSRDNRFNRYFATTDLSGDFRITGTSIYGDQVEGKAKLHVCMNCLKQLNYKGAALDGRLYRVRNAFSIPVFFETYSSCFPHMPTHRNGPLEETAYTSDWGAVKSAKKQDVDYVCEGCGLDLKQHKPLLHVHHIDGHKGNNHPDNLKALCVDCHRKEPLHDHLFVPHADMQLLSRLRLQQSLITRGWKDALQYSDPAIHGLLGLLRNNGQPAPEIGYELMNGKGEIIGDVEAAWPDRKTAIYIRGLDTSQISGWRLYSLAEAIDSPESIRL